MCPSLHLSLTRRHLHVNFSLGCHLPTQSSISLSVCLAGRINGLSLEQVFDTAAVYCTRLWPPDCNSLLHQYHWPISRHVCVFCQLSQVYETLTDSCNTFANDKLSIVLHQSQSTQNCKHEFPENRSQSYMCVYECSSLERRGGDQSIPERIPDYPPTEGKNQNPRGGMQEQRENTKNTKERRSVFI